MTKTTLFTAASAAVILFAGAAQAQEISGTIGGGSFSDTDAYTLASELVLSEDASLSSAAGAFDLTYTLDTPIAVGAGAPDVQYRVTFTIAGGEFSGGTNTADSVGSAETDFITAANTATTKTFIVTVGSGVAATSIEAFTLDTGLTVEAETGVTVSASVELLTSGIVTPVENTTGEVVDFAALLGDISANDFTATAELPDFTTFDESGSSATLANGVTIDSNNSEENTIYSDLLGNFADADDVVSSVVVTITGSQLDELNPTFGGAPDEDSVTSSTAVFTFDDVDTLQSASFVVTNSDEVRIQPGTFTASFEYEYNEGFGGAATDGPVDFGTIQLEGTNFIAPWVSGSQAQSQSTLRLSNTAASPATVSLTITNGVYVLDGAQTAFADADCAIGDLTLPAAGDLTVTPNVMNQCFGAFLRGDLLVTVQADDAAITAKMRNSNAQGTFETTLGRYSGTDFVGAIQP